MANTQLNNKVRNPKNLSEWLDIYNIDITDGNNYTITPSSHWDFSDWDGGEGGGSGGGGGGSGTNVVSTLSTTTTNIASYEDEDECLSLNQAITDAALSSNTQEGTTIYSLFTIKDDIATYDDECLTLGQALINAMLAS